MSRPELTDATNGAYLLDRVQAALQRYVSMPNRWAYIAVALYIVYTHAAENFQHAPRLLVTSAEKRSGKSRVLDIVTALCCNALVAANATVAAIFRSLGEGPRTVVLDEADTIFGTKIKAEQNEDLRGLINAGFMQGTPVLRTVGPNHVPTEFPVFAPVVMAAIGTLPDTIQDRAINVRMRRRKPSEQVQPYRIRRDLPPLLELRREISTWIGSISEAIAEAEPDNPLEDRAADLWEPLLAVADAAGGQWPILARQAARALTKSAAEDDAESSEGHELLIDLREIYRERDSLHRKTDFVPSNELVESLNRMDHSLWSESPLTPRRLATLLRPYGLRAKPKGGKVRGYEFAPMQDVFERYLAVPSAEASYVSSSASDQRSEDDASEQHDTLNRHTA